MADGSDDDLVDNEAGEGEEEFSRRKERKFEDSSEEDEDENQDEFEKDDFIVDGDDDVEDDGDGSHDSDDVGRRRREKKEKRKRRRNLDVDDEDDELHEDDIRMLRESGVDVDLKRRKKLRRLKKHAADDDDDDDFRDFGDDAPQADYEREREAVDEDVDDVEDDDDFIDDGGRSRRRSKKAGTAGVNSEAVRAARNVFGDYSAIKAEFKPTSRGARSRVPRETEDNSDGDGEVTDPLDDGRRKGALRKRRGSDSDSDRSADLDEDDDYSAGAKSDSDQEGVRRARKRPGQKPTRASARTTTDVSATVDALGTGVLLSADDTAVIETDVPERLQEHFGNRGEVGKEELTAEATWIYDRAFAIDNIYASCFQPSDVKQKIDIVLNYIHGEKLDVPFIAQYRRDYVAPELLYPCGGSPLEPSPPGYAQMPPKHPIGFNAVNYADYDEAFSIDHLRGVEPGYDDGFGDWTSLWKVLDWDKKWAEMMAMRRDTLRLIETSRSKGVPEDVTRIAEDLAKECQDFNELMDIERHIRLATEAAIALSGRDDCEDSTRVDLDAISEAEKQVEKRRRPNSRANRYTEYLRKGYEILAVKFGIVASELAVNLEGAAQYGDQYQECVPRDAEAVPLEMSEIVRKDLLDAMNASERSGEVDTLIEQDPAKLLSCARYLLAQEVLADPRVLRTARKTLRISEAKITTQVTDSGSIAVGENHPLRAHVNVQKKPVTLLKGTPEYALMKRAAEKGYCTIQVVFDEEREAALLNSLTFAATDGGEISSETVRSWNEERVELAKEVCVGLIERLKSEVDQDLLTATEECLHERLSHAASRRLLLGPSRPFENETGAPRVMAITVTRESEEEPDPAQTSRDNEVGKDKSGVRPYRRPGGPRITFVNLDRNGIFLNSEEVFGKWLERPAFVRDPPEAIALRLEAFLRKSKPQVIVVGIGSGGREAVRLRGDILEVLAKMAVKNMLGFMVGDHLANKLANRDMFEYPTVEDERRGEVVLEGWTILRKHVFSVPDDVARLHALTNAANVALPVDGMTLLEKRAIALGRFAQCPLPVYAGIAIEKDMVARLEMHRLHFMAKPEGRIEAFRRALTRSICIMGVDLNRILIVPHLQPMLTFVGGLGPLKAGALVRKVEVLIGDEEEGMEALASRKQLYASDFLSRRVFMSAIGFLRIRDPVIHSGGSTSKACEVRRAQVNRKNRGGRRGRKDDEDELTFYDPLDDSRIHPENYNVAVKIADEALRDENGDLKADLIDAGASNISKRVVAVVLDNPAGLDQLDLDLYASELERMGRGRLSETIKMVANEFHAPFRDNRVPLSTPEPRGEFYLATGADPLELRLGGEVTATNCLVARSKKGISCHLPYGLRGFVTIAQYSDDPVTGEELEKMVSNGSDLRCRIIGFKYEAFEIGLASKISVMTNPQDYIEHYKPSYDAESPYIMHFTPKSRVDRGSKEGRAVAVRAARLKTRAQGVVSHDFFHDVTSDDAVEHLRNASVGEVIIRPSGRGLDLFAFTAKFADATRFPDSDAKRGIFHLGFEVVNSGEANVKYVIGKEEFGSVEEMLERHVICVLVNMGEAMEFKKFMNLKEDGMKKAVLQMKTNNQKTIPYIFGIAEKPLTLNLYYIPGSKTVIVEPIKVVPDGFQFRKILHTSLQLLTDWFKRNMAQAPKTVAPSNKGTTSPFVAQAGAARGGIRASTTPTGHIATPLRDEPPPQAPMAAGRGSLPTAVSAAAYQSIPEPPPPRVTAAQIPDPPAKNPVSYLSRQNNAPHPPTQASSRLNPYGSGPPIGPGGFGAPPPTQAWGSAPPQSWGAAPSQAGHGAYPQPPPPGVPPPPAYNQYSGQAPHRAPPSHQRGPPPPPRGAHRADDPAAARRGQMPVPAWKKAEQGGTG